MKLNRLILIINKNVNERNIYDDIESRLLKFTLSNYNYSTKE